VFPHLEPGSYRLGTNKLGYLPTPGVESPLIILKEGETRENVDLTMTRGATLAGRVFDQSGQPLRNIGVGALQVVEGTRTRLVPSVATDQTNESGEFRVQSLLPGRYVLVANLTSGQSGLPAACWIHSTTFRVRWTFQARGPLKSRGARRLAALISCCGQRPTLGSAESLSTNSRAPFPELWWPSTPSGHSSVAGRVPVGPMRMVGFA
jgi:hypothetical protein